MISVKLNKYIEKSGLKKKKVAEMLDISAGHLSYILNDSRIPSIPLEQKIKQLIS